MPWANRLGGPGTYLARNGRFGVATRVTNCASGLSVGPVRTRELPAPEAPDGFRAVPRPPTSQHLAVLKEAELVTERREGTRRIYRANTDTMSELRAFLDDYWTSGLERLRDVAEAAEDRKRQTKG